MFYAKGRLLGLLFTCVTACLLYVQGVSGRGPSAQDLLIQDLLNDYHSGIDPSGFIDLSFHLWIRCVRFDKDKVKITTSAVENYTWKDFRLSWNPKDFGGVKKIWVPASLIWKPDFHCFNALDLEKRSDVNVIIESDGTVNWAPRALYKTLCVVEDGKPVCELSFGSWTYDSWSMSLDSEGEGVDLRGYMNKTCPNSIENFTSNVKSATYPGYKEPFSSLEITLNLKPFSPPAEESTA